VTANIPDPTHEVICRGEGAAGIITLNRPQALNALTHGMVRAIAAALDVWEHDRAITRVLIEGAGSKAFCAGGDIRQLHDLGQAGRQGEALDFWREEYILNARIKHYPKPYIALVDGIVMGGGVGVSLHGSHRVAGERFGFAMPEVGIGFFPDVGASHLLPRLPGASGMFIALTGERVRQADALALGLATHAALSGDMPALRAALVAGEPVDAVLERFSMQPGAGPLAGQRPLIDRCFGGTGVEAILAALDGEASVGEAQAAQWAATIRGKSPTSLALAHGQMVRGRGMDFAEAMRMEFRIVSRLCHGHDFYEGVRAVIIDKDNAPRWQPDTLGALDADIIARHFEPLGGNELPLAD
jgi:enoyl-CoA hydratase